MKKLILGISASLLFATAAQASITYKYIFQYEYSTSIFSAKKVCVYQKDKYINGVFKGSLLFKKSIYKFQGCQNILN